MYVSLSVGQSGFICMFFFRSICTYVPTLPTLRSVMHVCGLIQKTFFSLPFVLYLFLFRTRFSRSAIPLLITGRKPIYKELGGRLQNCWCGGGCGGK